jgi:hypothetical protein
MVMLMGYVLLPRTTQLLAAGFWTGVIAARGAATGGGVMACIGMGGAEGVGIGASLNWQQSLQMHMPTANVQMAALIMAAGDVKAK